MPPPSLVHTLLLAEFDIDKGSTLRMSVPSEFMSALPLDANVIAELMLPEGGHNRSDDSTIFIFNREVMFDLPRTTVANSCSRHFTRRSSAQCAPKLAVCMYRAPFVLKTILRL